MVGAILDQAGVLERLIGDLADFSRVEMGQLDLRTRRVDLVTIARESVVQAQAQSGLHEVRLVAPPALFGTWDPDRVFQIFQNLLSNALKYAPAGGQILVRIEGTDDLAQVSIHDQGMGVAAESLPHLFDRFF
jgi:signal transduction histidine kinase